MEEKIPSLQPLKGKKFVLTGTLETMSREQAKYKIRALKKLIFWLLAKNLVQNMRKLKS